MRMVLLGAPGAGKGTHARILKQRFQVPHIATGDLLRSKVQSGSGIGKRAQEIMNQGKLVPDDIVIHMIRERLQEADAGKGFILDGFPRTLEQAEALDTLLHELKMKLTVALDFKVSETVVIERLSGRRACPSCGANFHIRNIIPKKEGICDHCGAALIRRKDDDPETVRQRLRVYAEQTAPVLNFYRRAKILQTVNGDLDIQPLQKEFDKLFAALA